MAEEVVDVPQILSVRGGMSKEAIVRRIPPELGKKSLDDAIRYATKPDQLKDDKERSIADSIKQEMKKTGKYVIMLNGVDSVTAEKIKEEILEKYITPQNRKLEDGSEVQYGFAEIAVASVQEGGLEYRV